MYTDTDAYKLLLFFKVRHSGNHDMCVCGKSLLIVAHPSLKQYTQHYTLCLATEKNLRLTKEVYWA
jgi:hypothetical protein